MTKQIEIWVDEDDLTELPIGIRLGGDSGAVTFLTISEAYDALTELTEQIKLYNDLIHS